MACALVRRLRWPERSGAPFVHFARTVTRGVHMVLVHVSDPVMRERAQGVLQPLGGVDPQALADQAL